MKSLRISVRALMTLVLLAGCVSFALLYPTRLGAAVLLAAAITFPTIGLLGLIVRRGAARVFWLGVTVFGWVGVLVHFGPGFDTAVGPHLPSTALLQIAHPRIVTQRTQTSIAAGTFASGRGAPPTAARAGPGRPGGGGRVPSGSLSFDAPYLITQMRGGGGGFGGMGVSRRVVADIWSTWTQRQRSAGWWQPTGAFELSGYATACLVFAMLGGLVARRFHSLEQVAEQAGPTPRLLESPELSRTPASAPSQHANQP